MRARCLLLAALMALPAAAQEDLVLLANGNTGGWDYQMFDGIAETSYRAVAGEGGGKVLQATSRAGASGFTRQLEFNLYDTPWLHFRWRVLQAGANGAEKTRAGDDFAWRLYFVGKSGLEYRVLNLVYAQSAAVGEQWESPYAGFLRNIRLVAAAAHDPARLGQWQTSSVNLGELWRDTFADDGRIGLVGLMTDGDNSGIALQVEYGEITLSPMARP